MARNQNQKSNCKAYNSWQAMNSRCYNVKNNRYKIYGLRGIEVCERWKNSFDNFLIDMGHPPSRLHSLDRINSDLNYTPENCRWATPIEQSNNKRKSNLEIENGLSLFAYMKNAGLSKSKYFYARMLHKSYGWPILEAAKHVTNLPPRIKGAKRSPAGTLKKYIISGV